MIDTTNDIIGGNASVIDFGPALAARRAGKARPDATKRMSFSLNIVQWPLDDVRWLADRLDDMGGTLIAETLRKMVADEEAIS